MHDECRDEANRAAVAILVEIRDMLAVRERLDAARHMHKMFSELSQRVDADELPLVDVPRELRVRVGFYQMVQEQLEGELLSLEASVELYEANLKRIVAEATAQEVPS